MADEPGARSTLLGALLAGGIALVALLALNAADVGSSLLRILVAIVVGVVVAQVYERRLA